MLEFLSIMRLVPELNKSSFGGKLPNVVWQTGVIITFMVVAFALSIHGANECERLELTMDNISSPYSITTNCTYWTLGQNEINDDTCPNRTQSQLLFEFWSGHGTRNFKRVYFLASPKSQPSVQPPVDLIDGVQGDEIGYKMGRPYQRIFLMPINSSKYYVTVAVPDKEVLMPYAIRVSCVPLDSPPCPRPDNSSPDKECGSNGDCVIVTKGTSTSRECQCHPGWGDVDCQTLAPALSNGNVVSKLLQPGEWAFWQIKIPPIESQSDPVLLVEMSRGGSDVAANGTMGTGPSGTYGGDPFLFVMAKDVNVSSRVPYEDDAEYSDAMSALLQQNFHLRLVNLTAGKSTAEYYVAVYNYVGRQEKNANVTLRVRWTNSSSGPLCPNNCYGKGTCARPGDGLAAWLDPEYPYNFQCKCMPDYGGPLCEGTLKNITLSTRGDGGANTLQPGEWAFFVITIDRNNFDVDSDDLGVDWTVGDKASGLSYPNALFTFNTKAFPRFPSLMEISNMKRGVVTSYDYLFPGRQWVPMLISGSKLNTNYVYVLGLYNSDYMIQGSFNYTINIFIPNQSRNWLHPYMSVVLGVSSSLVLCLLLTLCRRVLQRYGWGPFRSRSADGGEPDGNMSRVQVAQMPPRNRGVPADIIDAFRSYEYKATWEEKAQLAKSRPEAQQPPPPRGDGPTQLVQLHGANAGGVEENQFQVSVAATATVTVTAAATASVEPSTSAGAGGGTGSGSGTDTGMPPAAAKADDDEPQCAVCLCEYEEGEVITQLPCKHEFHGICIRKWLQTHITCPICRESLLPSQPEPSEAGNEADRSTTQTRGTQEQTPQSQQQQLQQLSSRPPPPGWPWSRLPLAEATTYATTGTAAAAAGTTLGGAVVIPMTSPPPEAAAAASASRPGLLSQVMGGMRRSAFPRQEVSRQPVEVLQPSVQQQDHQQNSPWAMAPPRVSTSPGAVPEPASAELVPTTPAWGCNRGNSGSAAATVFTAVPPSPGSPQLLARGPTAILESSSRQRSSRGEVNTDAATAGSGAGGSGGLASLLTTASVSSPATTSPSRLAAGRHSVTAAAAVATALPLGADRALLPQVVNE